MGRTLLSSVKPSKVAAPETQDDIQQADDVQPGQGYSPAQSGKLGPLAASSIQRLPSLQGLPQGLPGIIVAGMGILATSYTIIFFGVYAWVWSANFVQYGLVHTSYTHTRINEQPATVIVANDHGDITITIKVTQHDGTIVTQAVSGPILNAEAWNNDLNDIIATAEVTRGQNITVHLVGTLNYWHLFLVRPAEDFTLVPQQAGGYKIVAA